MMIRFVILFASIAINGSTIPAAAAQCTSSHEIAATRMRWAAVRSRFDGAADHEAACRAYATSFYESVTTRQEAGGCIRDEEYNRDITALDSEIDAFNDLLSTQCGG